MVGTIIKNQRHDWIFVTKLAIPMGTRPNHDHYSHYGMLHNAAQRRASHMKCLPRSFIPARAGPY